MSDAPAFPAGNQQAMVAKAGLTKREWFAGMALQGILSQVPAPSINGNQINTPEQYSALALKMSDAMIDILTASE